MRVTLSKETFDKVVNQLAQLPYMQVAGLLDIVREDGRLCSCDGKDENEQHGATGVGEEALAGAGDEPT